METIISFKFITTAYQKDLSLLQNSSRLKQKGWELNPTYFPNRMARNNNNESQTGPHPVIRVPANPNIPTSTFWERLEALRPQNGNGPRSLVDETNPPTGDELTNLLLLEMLQKQGERL